MHETHPFSRKFTGCSSKSFLLSWHPSWPLALSFGRSIVLGLHCTPLVEDWSNQSWNTVLWLLLSRVHYLDVIRSISAISFLILASTHVSAPPKQELAPFFTLSHPQINCILIKFLIFSWLFSLEKGRLGYIVHHSKLPDKILWIHALLYKISSLGYILQVSFFLFCLNHLTQISYLPRFLVPALFPVISSPSCNITIFDHVTPFWEGSRRLETEQDVLFLFFLAKS